MRPRHVVLVMLVLAVGCGGGQPAATMTGAPTAAAASVTPGAAGSAAAAQRHPDIVDVEISPAGEGTFDLAVTVSSPYDSPERYADGWRVLAPDGTQLGSHTLLHDHAGEQPFTRTQSGLEIPADITEVTVEGRDQRYGYGGGTVTAEVPHGA